jgi:hypothetical protein
MTGDARDSEAVWRDLVAHYSAPEAPDGTPAPWPDREDLPATGEASGGPPEEPRAADDRAADEPATDEPATDEPATDEPAADEPAADEPAADKTAADERTADERAADETDPGLAGQLPDGVDPVPGGADPVPGVMPGPPRIRIIRPAVPGPPPAPADEDEEHFVPPPPPPLPKLDPVTKGAWVAIFGGPAYLLIGVLLGWQIPSVAAFIAVAAFVGGFATLVAKMGDRPPTDSGSDDGAVV